MRKENWQADFWTLIEASRDRAFEWGAFDCVTFAIDCASVLQDSEAIREACAAQFGEWATALEAYRAHAGYLSECAKIVMGEPVRTAYLCMGDWGLAIDDEEKELIVVHDGSHFICPAETGLREVPYRMVQYGWKI